MVGRFGLMLALAAVPIPAAAQLCEGAVRAPARGGWAEYVVQTPRGQGTTTVRYAIVGGEERGGRPFVRFETRVRGSGGSVVTQALVPGFPYESAALQEVIVQRGSETPVRWGPALLVRARSAPHSALTQLIVAACTGAALVGEEEVTVPAGAFRARHFRNAEAGSDIWVRDEVPFGIVKLTGSGGSSLELLDLGGGGRSSVTGTPRVVNGAH